MFDTLCIRWLSLLFSERGRLLWPIVLLLIVKQIHCETCIPIDYLKKWLSSLKMVWARIVFKHSVKNHIQNVLDKKYGFTFSTGLSGSSKISSSNLLSLTSSLARPNFFNSFSNSSFSGFHFLVPTRVGTMPKKSNLYFLNLILLLHIYLIQTKER